MLTDLCHLCDANGGNPSVCRRMHTRPVCRTPVNAASRIHAVISARLAQLIPVRLTNCGLTLHGRPVVFFDLLAKASDWDEDSVSRALDELWRRRLIEGLQGTQYDFTHDRIREVAVEELSPVRRRFFHRRIARASRRTARRRPRGPEPASGCSL